MMPRYTSDSGRVNYGGGGGGFFGWVTSYIALHMDSVTKILNHILLLDLVCDIFFFFVSFSVSFLPTLGFNPTTISLLLITQALLCWIIVNNQNNRMCGGSVSFLAPTEFKIGIAFGLAVGATILSFVVTHAFRNSSHLCNPFGAELYGDTDNRYLMGLSDDSQPENLTRATQIPPPDLSDNNTSANIEQRQPPPPPELLQQDEQQSQGNNTSTVVTTPSLASSATATEFFSLCSAHSGSLTAVWFWSGFSFWCNFVTCLLLWMGKNDLSSSTSEFSNNNNNHQYEHVHVPDSYGGGGNSSNAVSHQYSGAGGISSGNNISTSGYGPSGGYSDQPQTTSV